jgi:hypothetical protein
VRDRSDDSGDDSDDRPQPRRSQLSKPAQKKPKKRHTSFNNVEGSDTDGPLGDLLESSEGDTENAAEIPKSTQHQKQSVIKRARVVRDESDDSDIEILENPEEDAEAELGQSPDGLRGWDLLHLPQNDWPKSGLHQSTASSSRARR